MKNENKASQYKALSEAYKNLSILESVEKIYFAKDTNYGDGQFYIDDTNSNFQSIIDMLKKDINDKIKINMGGVADE